MSVLVYIENWDGKFKKSSFELASYASGVAEMMNTTVVAVESLVYRAKKKVSEELEIILKK